MRVRLKRAGAPKLSGATRAVSGGRRVRLRDDRGYRFQALGADRVSVIDTTTGRTRARLRVPVTVTGGASTRLHGGAENGLSNGFYRGRMVLSREGGSVLAVNHVSLEHYLYGVVPAEMPASWPAEALKAQAVVARSYALTSRSTGLPWDVFADVRSQVYRGVLAEVAAEHGGGARHARPRGDGRRRGRPDVLLLHLGRPHRRQRGGLRRHADRLPALGRGPARRPLAGPYVDGALQRARGAAPAERDDRRPLPGARGRVALAVGPRRDDADPRQRRQPHGLGRLGPDRAGAAQHLDRADRRPPSSARPRARGPPRRRRRRSTDRRGRPAALPPRSSRSAPATPSPARSRTRTRRA